MSTLTERLERLPPERRRRVEERALALIAEEISLRDLRQAREQTQGVGSGSDPAPSPAGEGWGEGSEGDSSPLHTSPAC